MPTYCAAFNCGSTSRNGHGISFFRFPREATRCKKWVINSRRADLDKKAPDQLNKNCYLCNSHFEDDQFTNSLHKKLNWNAVPTLFHVPNSPPELGCRRNLRRWKEIASACPAMQGVTSKDVPSLDMSVQTDCTNTGGMTNEAGDNVEEAKVDQQSSVPSEIGPHDTPVNKRKAECENTTAAVMTEAVNAVVQAPACPILKVNNQLPVPVTIIAPQTPVIRLIKLMPKIYRLPLQLNELNCGESIYKTAVLNARPAKLVTPVQTILSAPATNDATPNITAQSAQSTQPMNSSSLQPSHVNKTNCEKIIFEAGVINAQPTELIRPVQAILAAPPTSEATPNIVAQSTQPTDSSSVHMLCGSFKQTDHSSQSGAITSTQTGGFVTGPTATLPYIAQRVSRKQPDTPAEKKLKQRLQRMYAQLWRKNRKIEALKKKVSEIVPESARPQRSVEAIVDAARQFLTPFQLSLFRAQLMNSRKEKHGYRWSTSDKIFGLQLLYKSSAAFRFVSEHLALPTQGTLRRFVAETLESHDSEVATETIIIPPEDIEEATQTEEVLRKLA